MVLLKTKYNNIEMEVLLDSIADFKAVEIRVNNTNIISLIPNYIILSIEHQLNWEYKTTNKNR